jgi:hypothetical protein
MSNTKPKRKVSLSQLTSKPQLVLVEMLDVSIPLLDEAGKEVRVKGKLQTELVDIDFYTYDRQPLDIFMKLANANQQDPGEVINVVRTLFLDETGKQIIQGDKMPPAQVMFAATAKIVEILGNS